MVPPGGIEPPTHGLGNAVLCPLCRLRWACGSCAGPARNTVVVCVGLSRVRVGQGSRGRKDREREVASVAIGGGEVRRTLIEKTDKRRSRRTSRDIDPRGSLLPHTKRGYAEARPL